MRLKLFVLLFVLLSFIKVFAEKQKSVLLISSYNSRFPTFFQQIEGVKSVLDTLNVDLDVEFMDSKRFIDPNTKELFTQLLSHKLSASKKYDALITTDDNALNFVLEFQDSLFQAIPIVFCGVNNIDNATKQKNNLSITGVVESVSMKETVELMLHLFPEQKTLYAIVDSTNSGQGDLKTYYKISAKMPDFEFKEIDLNSMTFEEYKIALQEIPMNVPVLLLSAYCDKTKHTIGFRENISIIAQNLKSPLFHLWYHGMGEGVLGGKIISHFEQGKASAILVNQILSGEDISAMDVIYESPNVFIFDYNQLQKHDISFKNLPDNAIIINQPKTFYHKYKTIINVIIVFFVLLVGFIIVLVINILRRHKVEIELTKQNKDYARLNKELQVSEEELKITIEKHFIAKERAEENEQKLKESQTIAKLGGWEFNSKTGMFNFTDNFYNIFHTTEEEMGGYQMSIDEYATRLVHPEDSYLVEEEAKKAFETKDPRYTRYVEHRILYQNGGIGFIGVRLFIKKDKNGKTVKMYGVVQDFTDRKKIEQELIVAKNKAEESNRLKTQFLHNLSHEIRTPMNGIVGFSAMLNSPNISLEKKKYFTKIVKNSSHQLLRVIDDILEISSLETKQVQLNEEEFNLNDLLMEQFAIFNLKSKERNIPLYLNKGLSNGQSQIIADTIKLSKILSNLIENALKFTIEGFVEIGYTLERDLLKLYVKDTGIGIAPECRQIIFERFLQENKEISRKHGGLGLGLSISKENAMLLGGTITLESEKGKGSTFFLTIPYKPIDIRSAEESNVSGKNKMKKNDSAKILVAEDEEVNFLYIEALLQESIDNYRIIHAKNGMEAVDLCLINKDIDLILMDIKMPIMNGLEATKKIKQKFPNLPIIAQTAYSSQSDKNLTIKYGCDGFITKPLNKEKLFQLINDHLKNKMIINVCKNI